MLTNKDLDYVNAAAQTWYYNGHAPIGLEHINPWEASCFGQYVRSYAHEMDTLDMNLSTLWRLFDEKGGGS